MVNVQVMSRNYGEGKYKVSEANTVAFLHSTTFLLESNVLRADVERGVTLRGRVKRTHLPPCLRAIETVES